jgi:hypothetical protein
MGGASLAQKRAATLRKLKSSSECSMIGRERKGKRESDSCAPYAEIAG